MGREIVRQEMVSPPNYSLTCDSRPKTIEDVSAQEHTVAVLRRTLTSTNVSNIFSHFIVAKYGIASTHVVLWPTGNWKDINNTCSSTPVIRVSRVFFVTQHTLMLLYISPDNFRSRVLELNASDERGIAIVREKIKGFARQTPRAQTVSSDGKTYPCPPYKIIILDEADSMTQDAQAALRRIMENYARITRFCLVCNYVTRCVSFMTTHHPYISIFLSAE